MDNTSVLNQRLELIAWGVFLILLGVVSLFPGVTGIGAIGTGVILLGLNVARHLNHIPTSGFTITLGILALALGIVDLLRALLQWPDLPGMPVLLIVIGVALLVRAVIRR